MPIEQVAPRLERIIDLDQEVEWLASTQSILELKG